MSLPLENADNARDVRIAINGAPNFFQKVDVNGDPIIDRLKLKPVFKIGTPNVYEYIPAANEIVTFPEYNGMIAVGDGIKHCKDLDWIGEYILHLTGSNIGEFIPDPSWDLDVLYNTGIRKATIYLDGDMTYVDGVVKPLFNSILINPKAEVTILSGQMQSIQHIVKVIGDGIFSNPEGDTTEIIRLGEYEKFCLKLTKGFGIEFDITVVSELAIGAYFDF